MPNLEEVRSVLLNKSFRRLAKTFDRRGLIASSNRIGPPMLLLPSDVPERLNRIPHFDEGLAKGAIDEIDEGRASSVEIFMFSHRWLRSSPDPTQAHPDDVGNSKARTLVKFTQWRKKWVIDNHGFDPFIYYWIDYSCFDQKNLDSNLAMLPLWVACCERFVRFETPDYFDRAWCRLEVLLSYVFGFADHHLVIDSTFQTASQKRGKAGQDTIQDPSQGNTTDPADAIRVTELSKFAATFTPSATDRRTHQPLPPARFGHATVKSFRL
jgi:hypothetical protein